MWHMSGTDYLALSTSKDPFPYAVVIRPSQVTISRWTRSGDLEIMTVPGTENYRDYIRDAAIFHSRIVKVDRKEYLMEGESMIPSPPKIHDLATATSILREVIDSANQKFEMKSDYGGLFVPTCFNSSSLEAASKSMFVDVEKWASVPVKIGYVAPAACLAYGLDRCENLGRTHEECTGKHESENYILFIEYEEEYMHLSIISAEYEWGSFPSVTEKLTQVFGTRGSEDIRKRVGPDSFRQQLLDYIRDFIDTSISGREEYLQRKDIRAIIVSGDATVHRITEIQETAKQAVGNGAVKVLDSILSSEVVAYGAAIYARNTVLKPHLWGLPPLDESIHDEL
ncbi:hypothetical protein B0J11DRAFT_564986 [Dendryphion nanum]|uniref:Uncharacterized protein n=1 Tax=Dendryphion nanum TaxID=256645 RepID=A0A9P9IZ27_9PLEO|nr:hypothetical protein B0J11DRAFT_564986 [Dendryphion nanum]